MKILLVASEVAPIIKLGGLGDVAGSLPKALEKLGVDVDVIVPYFPFAKTEGLPVYKNLDINVPYAGENNPTGVFTTKLPGSNVDVIMLQNSKYFHSHQKTWTMSNEEELATFSFFDRAVVEYVKTKFNTYDLIHCNDWHTGLITHLLSDELETERPATLFTIHNLMYQGKGAVEIVRDVGIVPGEHSLIDFDISDGDLNMIQQGISSADFVNTVSPTYMKEILTKEYGADFSDILQARIGRTDGILNGLDYSSFPRTYDETNWSTEKPKIKKDLLAKLGLNPDSKRPLFAFVGRLDPYQKGIDLVHQIIPHLIQKGGDFVLLGTGDTGWQDKLVELSKDPQYSPYFSAKIMFDKGLAEQIYAASDFLIVPSKYEPCGLIQMIAMWYGSLPIVRATGGLKDSVQEGINGFLFDKYTAQDLINVVDKAFAAYNGRELPKMITTAMTSDFSWDKSAQQYKELYKKVIQLRIDSV
jgi:starch synthase